MPMWWGNLSSKKVQQKTNRRSFIDLIQRKLNIRSEEKKMGDVAGSEKDYIDACSEKRSPHLDSTLPSLQVSPCHCFTEQPHAQPLPLPVQHSPGVGVEHPLSGHIPSSLELNGCSQPLLNSDLLSGHEYNREQSFAVDAWGDSVTASISSNSSVDTNDQPDSQFLSPQASDYGSGNATAISSPSRHMDHSSIIARRILKDQLKQVNLSISDHVPLKSTKKGSFGTQVTKLQIAPRAGFFSAPDSYTSSPSRSPVKACTHEQVIRSSSGVGTPCSDMNLVGPEHCCNLGSEKISGPNPVSDQSFFGPQSGRTPNYSRIPSPIMISPSRGSCVQNGVVSPLHPMDRFGDGKPESHKLPLPPATACSSCPFSSSYVGVNTPTNPRTHVRPGISTSPVSQWKKGRLIGSGTFGQVYLGFNSETGEMCAMKEVTLFSDDSKSKESAQQFRQEITLLSHFRHPNIVQYFDSDMVDDKLYIYLEYVSGGSIYKILREYGELGESAIRSYTRQILSGLAYLHSKNTAHRDIKGANILVDPSGQVKLADFGMAKHITGQSCPFSFKGSPYWMAPEVIRNSNGCNLAVDIWSLGCTVIEMATSKPPWSQYEGVAALFKIGNSKELPTVPDHLSMEGKDFIRRCLQRNPRDRPSAIQLLGHPFIRNVTSPVKGSISLDPLGLHYTPFDAERYKGMSHVKTISSSDLEGVAVQLSRDITNGSGSRNTPMSKHISCPVSPIGSPFLHPKSSLPMYRNSTISGPQTASGSSTPCRACTSGNVAFPVKHLDHLLPYRKSQKSLYASGNPLFCKTKLETLSGIPEVSQTNGDIFHVEMT
ncbi:mitogen-activated protein kinase kinase kinase YODA-like [Chenopodium quinoa]|uniref:mitogen-activated protein kinase kinase kinase YODA-like n=1 Tax=Chenopodium quinoa TaxID=63459 RepID=UPI000B783852|nr:mitogen-activated protein kinase kinase kinase YODA-like [Chenopodium quinoa]